MGERGGQQGPIFSPDSATIGRSDLTAFTRYCEAETGRTFENFAALHDFSVADYRLFWRLFLSWAQIPHEGEIEPICVGDDCERAQFFPNVWLNFAEVLLGGDALAELPAITARHFDAATERLTRGELRLQVVRLATYLKRAGISEGDRVVVVARNGPQAIVAALATAAIGASFASCSTDMGAFAILSRFAPLKPVVLMGNLRAEPFDAGEPVADRIAEVARNLPSLTTVIALDDGVAPDVLTPKPHRLADIVAGDGLDGDFAWRRFPFNHPLFIMFSSGTTGAPKCIVHGVGGTLLEHLKEHRLHCGLTLGDKLFFQTSCAWMMWNWQLSALASGVELVVFDGPLKASETLWRIVCEEAVTAFGTSPAYLQLCERSGFSPGSAFDLGALRGVFSTGSILYPAQYDWVREHVGDLPLQSISGGTDIIGCFVLGNPNLPIHRGEAQSRSLGLDVRALAPPDQPDAPIGELICANPFPSRPLGLFGDADGSKFHAAYFNSNPGVWTHGDLIEFTSSGGARLHGRSDGVLKVHGIRVGPAEIYSILQDVEEIAEAMVVEQEVAHEPGGTRMVLLVVLAANTALDDALVKKIRSTLTKRGSPALLPARIADVRALPKTHNGKYSEAAARNALNGRAVRNREALQNPDCVEAIVSHPALRVEALDDAPKSAGQSELSHEELLAMLQEVWSRALGLASIKPTDNIHNVGADSLTIVNIIMEVERRLNCRLPFTALFSAPTVGELAGFILARRAKAANGEAGDSLDWATNGDAADAGPRIRAAGPDDVDAICAFLDEGFSNPRVSAHSWRPLFEYGWLEEKPNLGFMAVDGDEIVGFLGVIYARRTINGRRALVGNLTSWYVRSEYRGWGAALMAAAVRDPAVTYTAITPAPITVGVLRAFGFGNGGSRKLLFLPLFQSHTLFERGRPITFDTDEIVTALADDQRRVFDDHLPFDCLHVLVGEGAEQCYLVIKRRLRTGRFINFHYSEILYCSDWALLWRNFERVKLAILRRQRTAALVASDHHLARRRPLAIPFDDELRFRSRDFGLNELDKLYSEIVLFEI